MPYPHCQSPHTQEQVKKTSLGYRTFRCTACARRFNERSGTPFNDLSVPTDIVFLVVLWRLPYPLRLRHLAEMFLEQGFTFSRETVRAGRRGRAPAGRRVRRPSSLYRETCAHPTLVPWRGGPRRTVHRRPGHLHSHADLRMALLPRVHRVGHGYSPSTLDVVGKPATCRASTGPGRPRPRPKAASGGVAREGTRRRVRVLRACPPRSRQASPARPPVRCIQVARAVRGIDRRRRGIRYRVSAEPAGSPARCGRADDRGSRSLRPARTTARDTGACRPRRRRGAAGSLGGDLRCRVVRGVGHLRPARGRIEGQPGMAARHRRPPRSGP